MIEALLHQYVEQGRGCGCPGDDLVDEQARYLLGVHRSLQAGDQQEMALRLGTALQAMKAHSAQLRVLSPLEQRQDLLVVYLVVGLVLELPAASEALASLEPALQAEIGQRAEVLGTFWRQTRALAASGQQVAELLRAALRGEARSALLEHCEPRALAEAWDLEPSPVVRTAILHLLGDRSEQERRSVEEFLARAARELLASLPGGRPGLWARLTGWLRTGPRSDELFLELMRCLPCLSDVELRRDVLVRCAGHPAPKVYRRAVRQLFLEAEASPRPELYRPALEYLATDGRREVREEAEFAVGLLKPETQAERLQRVLREVLPQRRRSRKNRRRERAVQDLYHLEKVETPRLKRTMEPGQAPDCVACQDRCCHGPTSRVSLRLADLLRLRAAGLEDAIEVRKKPFTAQELAAHPHLERHQRDRAYAWFPILKQKEDGTCVFYGQDGRCSIYKDRPQLCRSFPYQLDLQNQSLRYGDRCASRKTDPQAAEVLAEAVTQGFNAKIDDLLLVHYAREELAELGLLPYLSLDHDPPE